MLISMTLNDEVKTIHASLNDGSLRKWEFEPYTEQGKIELTDQDYAKIQSIKGNTVKFNQLVQNGNFENTDGWLTFGVSLSVANNVASCTLSSADVNVSIARENIFNGKENHIIFATAYFTSPRETRCGFYIGNNRYEQIIPANVRTKVSVIGATASNITNSNLYVYVNRNGNLQIGDIATIKDVNIHDLTNIFGSGNEPTTAEQFETWLSTHLGNLDYYSFTLGDLIPFKGTGLKTTGKNLLNIDNIQQGGIDGGGANTSSLTRVRMNNYLFVKKGMLSFLTPQNLMWEISFYNQANIPRESASGWQNKDVPITIEKDCYIRIIFRYPDNSNIIPSAIIDSQIEYGSVSTSYEPYTESTLSLPISTYFPTGMKDIPNSDVYDEITPSRADTRIGMVDLGTLNWQYSSGYSLFYANVEGAKYSGNGSFDGYDCECAIYNSAGNKDWPNFSNLDINVGSDTIGNNKPCVNIKNTSFTDVATFKQAMSGQYLYYELETPTSQDISLDLTYPIWNNGIEQILPINGSTLTTSPMVATIEYPDRTEDVNFLYKQTTFESAIPQFSLVCKNQELPMTLEDGKLICECDSSITNESGFFDCKVKMQDLNSVAYSQKIQLHVERGIND